MRQPLRLVPGPPNFGLSRQFGQRPQSARLQPSQAPHRSTRSTLTTPRFGGVGRGPGGRRARVAGGVKSCLDTRLDGRQPSVRIHHVTHDTRRASTEHSNTPRTTRRLRAHGDNEAAAEVAATSLQRDARRPSRWLALIRQQRQLQPGHPRLSVPSMRHRQRWYRRIRFSRSLQV